MAIRAVVFDIGGVLEITEDMVGVDEKWERELGLRPGEMLERLRHVWQGGSIGTMSLEDVHRNIGEIMGMGKAQVNELMDDVWRQYLGTLNVELADYFRGLRPGYQTAIISNSFVGAREKEVEHYQFDQICDFIIYSHEVGVAKPDRRIFELACERLGLEAAEVVFVDDREVMIEAARDFGMHGIVFKDNAQVIAEIEACIAKT